MEKVLTACLLIFSLVWIFILGLCIQRLDKRIDKLESSISIKLEQPEFLESAISDSILLRALEYYGIEEPSIVLAQAKLETANYKSRLFKERNNLFGLYDSRSQQYFTFDHWINSIIAYKNMIEYRRKKGEDYYKFLQRIGYAEDKEYINKLKNIHNSYEL